MDSPTYLGRAFHNLGAANTKARSPRVALGLTIGYLTKVPSLELLKLFLDTGLEVIKKLKYKGGKPFKILKTINRVLNSILYFTGRQCKCTNKYLLANIYFHYISI